MDDQQRLKKLIEEDEKWHERINKTVEQTKRNYNGPHCCLTMDRGLLSYANVLNYDSKYREYGIKVPKSTGCILLDYCMFCGKNFPISVRDEWYDILEKEYGLESPNEEDKKKIPKEFLTDEWWKKRGL